MLRLLPSFSLLPLLTACAGDEPGEARRDPFGDEERLPVHFFGGTSCDPQMSVFPVADVHNIGYDSASCGTGTCEVICPDENANSDWGGDHHGIDVFAYHRAPLVAVADGVIRATGEVSDTSGLRVRLEDACGWHYYYGHMDEIVVSVGQSVRAGDRLGYMGRTGTASTHLHFNVSPLGDYSNDIDPIDYLRWTSGTACDGADTSADTSTDTTDPAPDTSSSETSGTCGWLADDGVLYSEDALYSCDGRFALVMQSDGNLVLYEVGAPYALWSTGTHGNAGAAVVMQTDGNLVIYGASGAVLWHSHTNGYPGAVLAMQDDGNLVIYADGRALWSSGT